MINPINISANPMYYNKMSEKQAGETNTTMPDFELSGYKTGQAILARNNITFRNLAVPIEVTDKYNKKTEGKDHLDLPNVHIYEYPDTNLQLFVNKNTSTHNSLGTDSPDVLVFILDTRDKNFNLLKQKMLCSIINNKLKNISEDIIFTYSNFSMSYGNPSDKDFLKKCAKINDILFNSQITDSDLQSAKNSLTGTSQESGVINALYGEEQFKSPEEIAQEIENITVDDIRKYYDEFKQNAVMQAFVTASKQEFENNKKEIFNNLNSNIPLKLKKYDNTESKSNFALNEKLKFVSTADKSALNYPVPLRTVHDDILGDITARILNNNKTFNAQYVISEKYYNLPFNLKDNSELCEDSKFYKISLTNGDDSLEQYKATLDNILNSSLNDELVELKAFYKERLKTTFTGERLNIIKNAEMARFCDDLYNLYEIIDSINEDDIKDYIKRYLQNQAPIVEVQNNTEKDE